MAEPFFGFGKLIFAVTSSICVLYLISALLSILHKLWWTPIRIQHQFLQQGIRGPGYKFLHGTTKEVLKMRKQSINYPTDISDHNIFPRIQPHIYSWGKMYGKNFLMWLGPRPQLVVTEPELIKKILNNKESAYRKTEIKSYVKKLLGDGIIVAEDEKWYKLRKVANHAFYAESLKGMIPAMIESVEMMLERWRHHEGKEIDASKEFKLLTSEVISRTAFGSSYLEGQHIFDMLTKMGIIIAKNDMKITVPGIEKFIKTSDDIDSDNYAQGIRDAIVEMIKKREEKVMSGQVDNYGNDFLGLLVKNHHCNDQNNKVSVDEMVDECKAFYMAGQETTSSMLSWSAFLLASHIDWQEKVRKEVIEVFGHQRPHPDSISKLKNMTMFINETLRLYGPAAAITRRAKREVRLGKLTIPANVELVISELALHHSPEFWGDDVNQFKPERFAEGAAKATNGITSAFMPFGLGPRNCVGSNFAQMEIKVALSMILQRYEFTLSPNYVHSPVLHLTIIPANGVQIMIQKL